MGEDLTSAASALVFVEWPEGSPDCYYVCLETFMVEYVSQWPSAGPAATAESPWWDRIASWDTESSTQGTAIWERSTCDPHHTLSPSNRLWLSISGGTGVYAWDLSGYRYQLFVYEMGLSGELAPYDTNISGAKQSGDSVEVCVRGTVVTFAETDFFYVEDDNRCCGIRVERSAHGLATGTRADIVGMMRTSSSGERYIEASSAVQSPPPNAYGEILPLGMNNRSVGGADWRYDSVSGSGQQGVTAASGLNNIGLLVSTWGTVVETEQVTPPAAPTWFRIGDGSGVSVKCVVPNGVAIDPSWVYVGVTGISSCEKVGDDVSRIVRVRTDGDIVPYAVAP